jgi:hypothetical protein
MLRVGQLAAVLMYTNAVVVMKIPEKGAVQNNIRLLVLVMLRNVQKNQPSLQAFQYFTAREATRRNNTYSDRLSRTEMTGMRS